MLNKIKYIQFILFISFSIFASCEPANDNDPDTPPENIQNMWTIMIYSAGDNDLESYLLTDIQEMKDGFINNQGVELIVIIDRIPGYSSDNRILEENFSDTRLYRITSGAATRIDGGFEFPEITETSNYEANMGDANTLKKFIRCCKAKFPAENYALIFSDHGKGPRRFCEDETSNNDHLYIAEVTDVLEKKDSVDLIGFDACRMGSIEVAYQYRPGNDDFNAKIMVASPEYIRGYGWSYDEILKRFRRDEGTNGEIDTIDGGMEKYYNPASLTALEFGEIIVEEQYDLTKEDRDQTLSCYDLSKVLDVKVAVDDFSKILFTENAKENFEQNVRGEYTNTITMRYFYYPEYEWNWIRQPLFDLYDLCDGWIGSSPESLTYKTSDVRLEIKNTVDEMIVYSFACSDIPDFKNGNNGLSIFIPDGDRLDEENDPHWAWQWWYNAIDINECVPGRYYGKLSWCKDNAISGNNQVENWFEMLDGWFDLHNNASGGLNGYQY